MVDETNPEGELQGGEVPQELGQEEERVPEETIKLQSLAELEAKEKKLLSEVPELVQSYLDLEERQPKGEHWEIVIDDQSKPTPNDGIAYSNSLCVKGSDGSSRYETGMQQYRGAYNHEIDNFDLQLKDPAILEESEDEVTYAVRTGVGNVKVYRLRREEERPERLESFNTREHAATQKRIELLQKAFDDPEEFLSYISRSLGHRERAPYQLSAFEGCMAFDSSNNPLKYGKEIQDKGDVMVLLLDHADRDYDPVIDSYRLCVWVKGKGFGSSETYQTGLQHPGGKNYIIGVGLGAKIASRDSDSLGITAEVGNKRQEMKRSHNFRIKW